jgi:hypothetical protein
MDEPIENGDQPEEKEPNGLDAIVAKLTDEFDKRFRGLQSTQDRRDAEYRQMLEDAQNASLEPEEREQRQASTLQKKLEDAQRKLEILQMRKDYPEEVDLLSALLEGKSLQDQLSLLASFRKAEAAAESQGEDAPEQPTPVDRNNPARKAQPSLADAGGKMNKALADTILKTSGNEPGLLNRLRKAVSE